MKMTIFFYALLLSFEVLAADLYYLKPDSINLSEIPLPPADEREDLNAVMEFQNTRTEAACSRAAVEAEGFATSFFGVYGPLTMEEAQKLVEFQERLFNEINYFSRILKSRHARLRPFDRDPLVEPCIPRPRSLSYPSGHATISYVAANTFSLLYPDRRKNFLIRADEIAEGRVLGGVHFPSDVKAGRILGEKIFEALKKDEKFMNDVKALLP